MYRTTVFTAALNLLLAANMLAQVSRTPVSPRPAQPRVEPCWQEAGIAKSAMQERAAISRETRMQVEGVCADTSLTPQQRQQKIREIRLQARQRMDALVTPQQQEALTACQKERAASHPVAPGVHHAATGPCGEMLPSHPAGPGQPGAEKPTDDETPPEN